MSQIVVFVVDVTRGTPANGVPVSIQRLCGNSWHTIAEGKTDETGCVIDWAPTNAVFPAGAYRLLYDTSTYSGFQNVSTLIFSEIVIQVTLNDEPRHVVPLLLGFNSYTTYLGS